MSSRLSPRRYGTSLLTKSISQVGYIGLIRYNTKSYFIVCKCLYAVEVDPLLFDNISFSSADMSSLQGDTSQYTLH